MDPTDVRMTQLSGVSIVMYWEEIENAIPISVQEIPSILYIPPLSSNHPSPTCKSSRLPPHSHPSPPPSPKPTYKPPTKKDTLPLTFPFPFPLHYISSQVLLYGGLLAWLFPRLGRRVSRPW